MPCRRRMKTPSPQAGGSASAAWRKRRRRRIEGAPPGAVFWVFCRFYS